MTNLDIIQRAREIVGAKKARIQPNECRSSSLSKIGIKKVLLDKKQIH